MNQLPHFEFLQTERLKVRVLFPQQYNYVFEHYSDDELKSFFDCEDERLNEEKYKYQNGMTTYRMSFCIFHLMEKNSGRIVGDASLHNWFAIHSRAEIGYAMRSDEYKNKGYMREAIRPIVNCGFDKMNLNRIEAFIASYNTASLKLVQTVGFMQEGYLKEHYFANNQNEDSLVFGLLKRDYQKK